MNISSDLDPEIFNAYDEDVLPSMLLCKLAHCSIAEQNVMRSASIIGIQFTQDLLEEISPSTIQTSLDRILNSLVLKKWLSTISLEKVDRYHLIYSFTHKMIQSTLYYSVSLQVTKPIHLSLGKVRKQ